MPSYVSPGVYVIEKDWSDYSPSLNSTAVGVLGFASTGPVGTATLVTTQDQLLEKFGQPQDAEGGAGLIGAYHMLERTNSLYFTRVATTSALVADVPTKIGTCPYVETSGIASGTYYLFVTTASGGDKVSKTTDPLIFNVASATYGAAAVEQEVNLRTTPSSPIQFIPTTATGTTGEWVGTFAGSGAAVKVWGFSSASAFPTIPAGSTILDLSTFSSLNADLSSASAGGNFSHSEANNGYGTSLAVSAVAQSSGIELRTSAVSGGGYVTRSLYPGAGYNYSSTVETYGVKIVGLQDTIGSVQGSNCNFGILKGGGTEESHVVNLTKNTSGTGLSPEDVINNTTDETNKTSDYIVGEFAVDNDDRDDVLWTLPTVWGGTLLGVANLAIRNQAGADVNSVAASSQYWKLVDGTYNYTDGVNGDLVSSLSFTDAIVKAAYIGNGADGDGIYSFLKEDIDISLLAMPGVTEQNIVNNAVSIAETSNEFLFVTNPPLGITSPQNAIAWSNGTAEGRTAALNSSYACVYWPWVKLFNVFTQVDEYLSPDIFAVRQMSYTDANFDAWIAPAGLTRGRLTKPVDVEVVLTQGDRDALYGPGNVINPIQKFTTDGIVIWGQRTTQRIATALDRVNVRRLMIVIRKMLLVSTRQFVFEPNDAATWSRIVNAVEPMLADIKSRRGITEFRVICDGTTNTPLRIDRSELWCKIIIQPTKAAEVIVFELNLTSATLGTNLPTA